MTNTDTGKENISDSLLEEHVRGRDSASEGLDMYPSFTLIRVKKGGTVLGFQASPIAQEDNVE